MQNNAVGFRLSVQQNNLWQQQHARTAFRVQCAVELTGELRTATLKEAFESVVAAHEILRTTFQQAPEVEQPVQVINESGATAYAWQELDLRHLSAAERDTALGQLCEREAAHRFDYAAGPLLRLCVVSLSEDSYALVLTQPAMCADGWSAQQLVRDIACAYEARLRGDHGFDESPLQYIQYSEWQHEIQGEEEAADGRAYWSKQLSHASPLALSFEQRSLDADTTENFSPARIEVATEGIPSGDLKALTTQQQCSVEAFYLGCWQALLARLSQQTEVVVGVECDGRRLEELQEALGLFARTVPVRARVKAGARVSDLLRATQAGLQQARELQDYWSWEVLQPAAHAADRFFRYGFVYEPVRVEAAAGQPKARLLESYSCVEQFALRLKCIEAVDGRIKCELHYDRAVFERADVERLAIQFAEIARSAARDAARLIGELEVLGAEERELLVHGLNRTARDYDLTQLIHEIFEAQVERTPDAVAVIYEEQQLTYRELNEQANQLAHYLRRRGVGADSLVAVMVERSVEMVVGLLGILKAGGAYLPLDPAYPQQRLAFMIQDAQAALLLTQEQLTTDLPPHTAELVLIDADWTEISRESVENPSSAATADNLAYVIYTSGSTGQPKGVMISHRAICNHMLWMADEFPLDADDRVMQKTPFSFDASVWEFFAPLLAGAKLVMLRPNGQQDVEYFVKAIAEQRITILQLVPSLLRALLDERGIEECGSLRRVFCGGEPLPSTVQEAFSARLNATLHNLYGPTEATIDATFWKCERQRQQKVVSIGRPIANMEAYVLDERQQVVPMGVAGELYVGGAGLARGYKGRAEQTAERFIPHPYAERGGARLYRTGDIARWLSDGTLEYIGRADHQVKIRGYRIELGEIEAALSVHESVREAVIVARDEASGAGQRLVCYCVLQAGATASVAELREHLRASLPEYMVPSVIVLLEEMPLTPNGKIDRRALPVPEDVAGEREQEYVAPRTPVEELLTSLWREVLGVPEVGVFDNFFSLGGHSLLATQLVSRIRDAFNVELSLRTLFEAPTPEALGERIAAALRSPAQQQLPPVVPVARHYEAGQRATAPLSFAQQRLWFLEQLMPGATMYHIPVVLRVGGALDLDALERSLSEVVRRHEALRTTFGMAGEQAVQVIHEAQAVRLEVEDLSGQDAAEREAIAEQRVREEMQRPFDLSAGPLVRVRLLRLAAEEHVLLLTMHHIISDGWSMNLLVQEVSTLYTAYSEGRESPLAELAVQYADYAQWQRQHLSGEVLDEQLQYWRGQLTGVETLELPTDYPRPAIQSYRGATHGWTLSPELSEQLRELSRREGATLFMTLLAAWQVLLMRYSGQTDITVGTPVAGRTRAEVEPLIGFFVNTLVLRTQMNDGESFRETLAKVREVCLGAYAHQEVPFEMLVEQLQPERSLSHSPLFQVMFTLQNTPEQAVELAGVQLHAEGGEDRTAKFDLSLTVWDEGGAVGGGIQYSTDLFAAETVGRMLRHYERVLAAMVSDATQRVSEIELLDAEEQRQLLVEWNDTAQDFPQECIQQVFERQVARTPEAVALSFEEQEVSYRELNARANQLAHYLQGRGVGPDVLVGVMTERGIEMVVALLAILKAGGAYLPLDPSYPRERLAFMLEDAGVELLLTQRQLVEVLPPHRAALILLDGDETESSRESVENPLARTTPENLAYVIYTSGSTGQPKGVGGTHRGAVNRFHWMWQQYPFVPGEVCCQKTSLSFVDAVWEVFGPLLAGVPSVLIAREDVIDARRLVQRIEEHGVSRLVAVPSLLRAILESEEGIEERLRSLRYVVSSGEALSRELAAQWQERVRGSELLNLYGSSEVSADATSEVVQSTESGAVKIGKPIANMEAYVLDREMRVVPLGVMGELYVGGAGMARGYMARAEQTAERFIPHPYAKAGGERLYRTGDIARWLADGRLEYVGRADYQVKVRGYRIELGEIEAALSSHESVREAVVVARDESGGGKRLVGYVVAGDQVSGSQLQEHLRARLPEYMVPSVVVVLDEMPLTPNGKVDRKALAALENENSLPERIFIAARTDTEAELVRIWSQVLGLEQISVTDNLFQIGGHSLIATQLLARARASFGVELMLRDLFATPTIEHMAVMVEEAILAESDMENIDEMLTQLEGLDEDEAERILVIDNNGQ